MTETTSPLAEALPTSLQELFDRDPLSLTDDDIDRIVAELRAQRSRWEAGQRAGKKAPAQAAPTTLSLEDLGL
jgi:hypothetical protein